MRRRRGRDRRTVSGDDAGRTRRRFAAAGGLLILVGCITAPDWVEKRGVIQFFGSGVKIDVPDTVAANAPFTVRVITYGGECKRKGSTQVTVDGLTVTIEPYDSVHTAAEVCMTQLDLYFHEASLRFAERGTAIVRVTGVVEPADTLLTVTRDVVVR